MVEAGSTRRAEPPPGYEEGQMEASAAPPSSAYSKPSAQMATPGTAAAFPGSNPKPTRNGESTICRTFFWINAGVGWAVWVFSVSAAADENWIEAGSYGYGVLSDYIEEFCEDYPHRVPSFCMSYDFFSASQTLSTVLCSIAVVLYTIAFFRPAKGPYGSAQVLGLVGGILMIFAAFFQMLAFFADMVIEEWNEVAGALLESSVLFANTDDWEKSRGPTYGVGTTAFVSSAINAITAFVSYQLAGDGPIFRFIGSAPAERAGAAHG